MSSREDSRRTAKLRRSSIVIDTKARPTWLRHLNWRCQKPQTCRKRHRKSSGANYLSASMNSLSCALKSRSVSRTWRRDESRNWILKSLSRNFATKMREEGRRVVWTLTAKRDLRGVWRYYARVASDELAEQMVRKIQETGEHLSHRALMWRTRNDIAPDLRSVLSKPYVIFYHVDGAIVEVLRVLHERRILTPSLRRKSPERRKRVAPFATYDEPGTRAAPGRFPHRLRLPAARFCGTNVVQATFRTH
jgi:plasmid stabilization system protein ParE